MDPQLEGERTMIDGNYKYFAFISYSSKDTEWGKRLQRKLEHYRMPAALCHERGWQRTPIKPVFFAPTDIQPGGLTSELQERLQASRNLIVVCSPHSAQSEWVGREIAFFHQLGRTNHIHFFIVDGVPHSGNADTECFNPIIGQLGLPEILGANVYERDVARTLNNLAILYANTQRYAESETMYQEALAIRRRLAANNPYIFEQEVATTLSDMGWVYISQKDYVKAHQIFSEALTLWERLRGADHPMTKQAKDTIELLNQKMTEQKE